MLIAVGRRALYDGWAADDRVELAETMRDHQQFGYARRLLGRVRSEGPDSEKLRQQHALCTYKDMELPAARRLDRALSILTEGGPLEDSTSAETLGIAGAIFKRKWEVDAARSDLESAPWCYERGFEQVGDPRPRVRGHQRRVRLRSARGTGGPGARNIDRGEEAPRARRRDPRTRSSGLPSRATGSGPTRRSARHSSASGGSTRPASTCRRPATQSKAPWQLETTTMQLAALARLRKVDQQDTTMALTALVGSDEGALLRATIGKVGVALSGGGFRASLFHIGVLARLAECNVLRHVEILSCVSGGSIVGAHYYLKLRQLLQSKPDGRDPGRGLRHARA